MVALAHLLKFDEWFKNFLLIRNLNGLNQFLELETVSIVPLLRASPSQTQIIVL